MTLGLLDPQIDAPVDMIQPVNKLHPLNRGLLAWWLVLPGTTGGSRLMDIVNPGPNGNHGTLTNMDPATDWVASNRPGGWGALDFNGINDYVNLGGPIIGDRTAWWISCWFKSTTTALDVFYAERSTSVTAPLAVQLALNVVAGQLRIFVRDNTNTVGFNSNVGSGSNDGFWHNIQVTARSKSDREAYLDGISVATNTTSLGTITVNTGDIARDGRADTNHYQGVIDDVRIWDRGVSTAEVAEYYQLSRRFHPGLLNRLRRRAYSVPEVASAMFAAGEVYVPGIVQGETYVPGASQGEVYVPGIVQGET